MRVLVLARVLVLFVVLVLVLFGLYWLRSLLRLLGGLGRVNLVVRRLDIAQSGWGSASIHAQCAQWKRECSRGMLEAGAGSNARYARNQ